MLTGNLQRGREDVVGCREDRQQNPQLLENTDIQKGYGLLLMDRNHLWAMQRQQGVKGTRQGKTETMKSVYSKCVNLSL